MELGMPLMALWKGPHPSNLRRHPGVHVFEKLDQRVACRQLTAKTGAA